MTIALDSVFEDPDGDPLTYAASSSAAEVMVSTSGSTLTLTVPDTDDRSILGTQATVTVTASDGKGDGDASLSFTANVVQGTPKPFLSKPSLFLDETPFDHAVSDLIQGGRDSYTVTLSCPYLQGATVEIANTRPDVLQVTPTTLNFSGSNWDVPQTVTVATVGRITAADDSTLQELILPHIAVTTDAKSETVRNRTDLTVHIRPATTSIPDQLAEDLVEAVTEQLLDSAQEAATNAVLTKVLKKVPKVVPQARQVGTALEVIDRLRTLGEMHLSSEAQINNLAAALFRNHQALQDGSFDWTQALSGQPFSFPLSLSQDTSQNQNTTATTRFNALFSGNVDFSRFSDSDDDFDFDGSTTSYHLGLDVIPNPDLPLVTGLHLAFTRSHSDFQDTGTETRTDGAYALQMFSVHPSIIWDATDRLTLWTSLGYGRGETELTIDSVADSRFSFVHGSSRTTTGDFFSVAAGANVQLWQSDTSALTIKVDGSTASFLDTSLQEGRLAAQLSRDFTLNTGRLKSSADLALLLSNSDTSAMELSGSLNWLPDQGRLSGTTSARLLLFGGDRSEWGIGGGILLLPAQQGEGLSLSLQPSFGQANASLAGLGMDAWDRYNDLTELALHNEPPSAQLRAELAYGFRRGNALLTPYSEVFLAQHSSIYGAGLRYDLNASLDLDLKATHRSRANDNNDNRLLLQLRTDL